MLEMRPGCECCDAELPPDSDRARICSLECTFCADCADALLHGICPNCGDELVQRPRRSARWLSRFPGSPKRVVKPDGCVASA